MSSGSCDGLATTPSQGYAGPAHFAPLYAPPFSEAAVRNGGPLLDPLVVPLFGPHIQKVLKGGPGRGPDSGPFLWTPGRHVEHGFCLQGHDSAQVPDGLVATYKWGSSGTVRRRSNATVLATLMPAALMPLEYVSDLRCTAS